MKVKVIAALSAVALLAGAGFAMSADTAAAGDRYDKDRSGWDKHHGKYGDKHGKHKFGRIVEVSYSKVVRASHPQQKWTAEVTTTIKKFVPKYGSPKIISVDKAVTGCWNHQGKAIGGYANNPNCQPAYY